MFHKKETLQNAPRETNAAGQGTRGAGRRPWVAAPFLPASLGAAAAICLPGSLSLLSPALRATVTKEP